MANLTENIAQFQTNFTSGIISPFVYSRVDISQYGNSARQMQNMIVRPHGGAMKRSGTRFVAEIANSANDAFLLPFVYSNTDYYQIEIGAGYFRFYRDHGQILSSTAFTNGAMTSNITGWTTNNTGTGSAAYNAANGGVGRLAGGSSGIGSMYQALTFMGTSQYTLTVSTYTNAVTYKIGTTIGGTDIATGILSPGVGHTVNFTPTTAGTIYVQFSNPNNNNADVNAISISTPIYQIDNPYLQAEIESVRYSQSFDTFNLTHNLHAPFKLTRTNHANWTLTAIPFVDGPYYDITDAQYGGIGTGITMRASAVSGSVTVTASAPIFVSTDVGRILRLRAFNTNAWGWGTITAITDSTQVTVVTTKAFDSTGQVSTQWRLGYWSDTTGWPTVSSYYQQRFILANNTMNQQTMWFSVSSQQYNFQPDDSAYMDNVIDSSAMTYTIGDNQANVINWLATQQFFFVGTSGGIWLVDSSTGQGAALTPTSITIRKVSSEASAFVDPLLTRTAVVYPHLYGRKMLEISYQWANNWFQTDDLAKLAENVTFSPIQRVQSQINPNYVSWHLLEDGTLAGCTYLKEQQVTAWHQHIIGGSYNDGNALVQSISVIPDLIQDELWMIVKRTINGTTRQYVEYMTTDFIDLDISEAAYLDCSFTYSGGATSQLTGLSNLEGETVQCFGDSSVVTVVAPVSNGSINVVRSVSNAVVGYSYVAILETQAPNFNMQNGPTHPRQGRIYKAGIDFYKSYGGLIGSDFTDLNVIPGFTAAQAMTGPITLFSGLQEAYPPGGWKREPTVLLVHNDPIPFCVTGITLYVSWPTAV